MNKNTILPAALVATLMILGSNSIAEAKSVEGHRNQCPVERTLDHPSTDKLDKNYHKYNFKKGVLKEINRHKK